MYKSNIILKRNPIYELCPSCKQKNSLHRSKAKNIKEDIIKKITFYRIYRCKECGWRGYKSTFGFSASSAKYILFYIALLILVVIIVDKILSIIVK